MNKRAKTLESVINGYVIKGDPILRSLLLEADQRKDAVLNIISTKEREYEYVSALSTNLYGYSPEEFMVGQAEFFFRILHEEAFPNIVSSQVECIKRYKDPSFNPGSEFLEEFSTPIKTPTGNVVPLVSLVAPILFTPNADVEYVITLICADNEKTISECKKILLAIKRRHNEIYKHPPFIHSVDSLKELYVSSRQFTSQITTREAQVLSHIANGLSTEEISIALNISTNTVETHRKNLLLKFDAKNSVELVKKATKQYWIE